MIKNIGTGTMGNYENELKKLRLSFEKSDAIIIGAGSGLSASAGSPFWNMAAENPDAVFASVNLTNPCYPVLLENRSIVISMDIDSVIHDLL